MELSIRVTRALHDLGLKARLLITGAHDPHEPKSMDYYYRLKHLSRELEIQDDVLFVTEYFFESGERLSVDRIIMRDLYLIADILFLPSIQEGFGIPLLESGMIKLPIVCSNISPFLEIGGEEICTFDLNDSPQKIAEGIMDFVENLKTRKMFRRVIRKYSWDNIYHEQLLPLLADVVSRR
jgi:glycosyltransferase involved in cell wall biosynthesis